MTDAAPADPKAAEAVEDNSEEDSDEEPIKQEDLDAELMEAAKSNDIDAVVVALDKQANP
jgi:hypothetical protein